ncbi:hypothetical protein AAVH_30500, partial [Aphelenchoides avenae]
PPENNNLGKTIYNIDLYKWPNKEETQCLECTPEEGPPKIIKTAKYSISGLVSHLAVHDDYRKKYEEQLEKPAPPITPYLVTSIGTLSVMDRKTVHYIACTHAPFNIVNHPAFKSLFFFTHRSSGGDSVLQTTRMNKSLF